MIPVDNSPREVHQSVQPEKKKRIRPASIPVGVLLSCGPTQVIAIIALPIIGSLAIHHKIKEKAYKRELNASHDEKELLELHYNLLRTQKKLIMLKYSSVACSLALIPFAGAHASINYFLFLETSHEFEEMSRLKISAKQQLDDYDSSELEKVTL